MENKKCNDGNIEAIWEIVLVTQERSLLVSGRRDIQYLQFHEDQNFPGIFFLLVEFKVIVGFPNIRVHNVYHETMREERSDGKDKMKNY